MKKKKKKKQNNIDTTLPKQLKNCKIVWITLNDSDELLKGRKNKLNK